MASCSAENESYKYSFRLPLLNSCESYANKKLRELSRQSGYVFEIVKYDEVLPSHPDMVGYIELKSNHIQRNILASDIGSVIVNCYPRTVSTVNKVGDYSGKVSDVIELNERMGIEKSYIVDVGDKIEIHYRLDK